MMKMEPPTIYAPAYAIDDLKFRTGLNIEVVVASEQAIEEAIARYYEKQSTMDTALEGLVAQDQATSYEVTEFDGDDPTWMFDLLRNPAFTQVPPANLHELFSRFEPMAAEAGQVIIRQGDAGDYYYFFMLTTAMR